MKKFLRRTFVIILVMMLLAVLFSCKKEEKKSSSVVELSSSKMEPVPSETGSSEAEPSPEPEPSEPEKNGDIVILYTSDVHAGIDQGFGYDGVKAIKDYLYSQGNEVILVDNGDAIQGEPVATMTRGESIIDIMNTLGYSVATPGNHEFDYGMDQFKALCEKADFPYISCNFTYKDELVLEPFVIRELGDKKIAFVGVTTPKTLITTSPKSFMDENGEFVYGFMQDVTGQSVYDALQKNVDKAREDGADYVVVMGHLGNEAECAPWTYADIIQNTKGIDLLLDGHSHDTEQVMVKNKEGKEVPRTACGTKLSSVGWCRISADGKITTGLYNWTNSVPVHELLGIRNEVSDAINKAMDDMNEKFGEVVAKTTVELTISDPVEVDGEGHPIRMVRRAETNLGDFCADAYRDQSGADVAFVNGGGIRGSIKAGKITLQDIFKVHPFGNNLCVIEVTGQQILDALEWGSKAIPGEDGGFLQVSGMSYEIHSYIPSSCVLDEYGMFAGVEGERRVKNVKVSGEPLDPEKKYTLAGHDFMLRKGHGDGYTMFDESEVLQDSVKLDNQVLIDYMIETLGGTVGEQYENPYGEGRIVIVEEKP